MKRLCVFYKNASDYHKYGFRKKPVEWMVCKECQRKINRGDIDLLMQRSIHDRFKRNREHLGVS
jgi:hypothetical protein